MTIEPGDYGVYETIGYAFTGYCVCIDGIDYELLGSTGTAWLVTAVDDDMMRIQPERDLHIPFVNDITMLVY